MKIFRKPGYLPPVVLLAGVITAMIRFFYFSLGTDERGLYPAGSPLDTASWVLVALVMAVLFLETRKLGGMQFYRQNFPAGTVPALGIALTGVALILASIQEMSEPADSIQTAATFLGFLAAASLLLIAWCRYIGSKPNVLLHTAVSVFLILYLVSHYRLWSSYSQLQNYAFELLAIVFIMLACYQRTAFAVDMGNRRSYAFYSLAALYFSIATLPSCENPVFFLGCAVWMYFTPCCMRPDEDKKEETEEIAE